MSVGLQRLREDAGHDPRGRHRQGRGPGARRSRPRARRRAAPRSWPRARRSRPSATRPRSRSARRSRAAPRPTARRSPTCGPPRPRPATRIAALDAELADDRGRRSTTCSCASRTRPTRTSRSVARRRTSPIRTWGEQLPRDQPLVGEVGADAPPAARPGRAGRTGSSATRSTSSTTPAAPRSPARASRSTRAPARRSSAALINWFLDVHTRENGMTEVWPPAVVNTASATGHRPDPGQGRPDVRRHPRRAVPGPDRRGPGHQPPPRRDPRGRPSCRSATRPTRRASGARPARPARTPAGSCGSTSSTRSRWSCSSARRTPPTRSSG